MALSWVAIGVEVTIVLALFGYIWNVSQKVSEGDRILHDRCKANEMALADHREKVARDYATRADMQTTENRLDGRLERIEKKLDDTLATFRH